MSIKIRTHNNEIVLSTELLAKVYGTTTKRIINNFNNNKIKYIEDKHYFKLEGEEKMKFLNRHQISAGSKAKEYYLWTEKGALLHAKSLGTDQAWDRYDKLVDQYFSQREQLEQLNIPKQIGGPDFSLTEFSVSDSRQMTVQIAGAIMQMITPKLDQLATKEDIRDLGYNSQEILQQISAIVSKEEAQKIIDVVNDFIDLEREKYRKEGADEIIKLVIEGKTIQELVYKPKYKKYR